jgi:hypothetical protein
MILGQLSKVGSSGKVSLTKPNTANKVLDYVQEAGFGKLLGMPGVFFTGSTVWRWAYGMEPNLVTDVDLLLVEDTSSTVWETRDEVVKALGLKLLGDAAPSMSDGRERAIMPGQKYVAPNGRVVDIWGMAELHTALTEYPEESHASARMAFSAEYGALLMYPNTRAAPPPAQPAAADPFEGFFQ